MTSSYLLPTTKGCCHNATFIIRRSVHTYNRAFTYSATLCIDPSLQPKNISSTPFFVFSLRSHRRSKIPEVPVRPVSGLYQHSSTQHETRQYIWLVKGFEFRAIARSGWDPGSAKKSVYLVQTYQQDPFCLLRAFASTQDECDRLIVASERLKGRPK